MYGPDIPGNRRRNAPRPVTMPFWNRCGPKFPSLSLPDLVHLQKKADRTNSFSPKELPSIQRYAWRGGPTSRVPSPDGTSGWGARPPLALLARVLHLPWRALDRTGACVGPVRHRHLLYLHILLHVHRCRVSTDRGIRARVQYYDAHVVRGGVPPLRGGMYHTLGTVGATLLLAGLTTAMAPLPFVLRYMGPRTRDKAARERREKEPYVV
ncbi:hypothetical protein BGW80DRAFT_1454478 [Lactifluus volemus]|nr:hypothetical protein BGW80DRAFT_1454478 [Lactifluus volemus]